MLQEPDGLPATQNPHGYPLRIDWDGILVDDPDHSDDIIRRVRDVLEVILDESLVRSPTSFEGNPPPLEPEDQGPGTRDQGQRTKGVKKLEKDIDRQESFFPNSGTSRTSSAGRRTSTSTPTSTTAWS